MKLTNKHNLPDAVVNAIKNDSYDRGDSDFTVTELLKPSRQRALQIIHKDEIEEDVSDMLWRLYGQLGHTLMERGNDLDLAEHRFYSEFLGKKVSGQIDTLSLRDGILSDYKFTSAWTLRIDKPPKPEYVAQLNMQLELIRRNGFDAKEIQIVGLLRDYRLADAKKMPTMYPPAPIRIQKLPIWKREKTVQYIEERIKSHLAAEQVLPECTSEERWVKPGKKGFPRCEEYCSISEFCTQFNKPKVEIKEEENAF